MGIGEEGGVRGVDLRKGGDRGVTVDMCELGHGGDGFLKFQDAEEISNHELGDAFEQMWQKRRCVVIMIE